MNTLRLDLPAAHSPSRHATPALNAAARLWFVVAVLGQLAFSAYVLGFYGRAAIEGRFEAWNKVMPHGIVAGDALGNVSLALHLLLTNVVIVGGALQLLPALRRRAPTVHRWNGRLYLGAALLLSVGGLFMVWTRGTVGGLWQHLGISLNALLIIAFAVLALRAALARRFDAHRRWALRLFIVVGGVWFFRIGLMAWLVANRGPVGFDPKTFTGPFLVFLQFASYLLPLAVLELYLRAQRSGSALARLAMAVGLAGLTLPMAGGIVAATLLMWLPRL